MLICGHTVSRTPPNSPEQDLTGQVTPPPEVPDPKELEQTPLTNKLDGIADSNDRWLISPQLNPRVATIRFGNRAQDA